MINPPAKATAIPVKTIRDVDNGSELEIQDQKYDQQGQGNNHRKGFFGPHLIFIRSGK